MALFHVNDHFWWGTGIGKFTWYYPQWQAEYFKKDRQQNEKYAAGETYIAFNDLLQLFESIGLLRFLLLLIIFFLVLKTKPRKNKDFDATRLTLYSILLLSLTSYPFHVNILLLDLFLCILIQYKKGSTVTHKVIISGHLFKPRAKQLLIIFSLPIYIIIIWQWYKKDIANQHCNDLLFEYSLPIEEQIKVYQDSYKFLRKDGKFLTDYGIVLLQDSVKANFSIMILKEAKRNFVSSITVEALGNAFLQKKRIFDAEEQFEWLTRFVPNLFKPRATLLKIYIDLKEFDLAQNLAKSIIEESPKVASSKIYEIKAYALNALGQIDSLKKVSKLNSNF